MKYLYTLKVEFTAEAPLLTARNPDAATRRNPSGAHEVDGERMAEWLRGRLAGMPAALQAEGFTYTFHRQPLAQGRPLGPGQTLACLSES